MQNLVMAIQYLVAAVLPIAPYIGMASEKLPLLQERPHREETIIPCFLVRSTSVRETRVLSVLPKHGESKKKKYMVLPVEIV